ncbi:MAG: Bug family tripartite tricarboxylate transporter substrate binding protein [Beijerinckiaceae bacterium]
MKITKGIVALSIIAGAAGAQADEATFFKDRQLRIVVGSAAGAGYDLNARLFARHYPAHLGGNPTIVVQNQIGAGSVVMANTLFNSAPRDGSVIGAAINGMPSAALFTPDVVQFDPRKFNWLGSTNRETQLTYVWHTAPVRKLADLRTTEVVVGATTPGTTQYEYPIVAAKLLGLKYKVISGYKGTTDIHLAMERGELQGMGSNGWLSLKTLNSNWIAEKKIIPIVQFNFERNPELADVPTIFEVAKTESDKKAFALMVGRLEYGRPFFLPPGVPQDRVAYMRRAFDATMKDPAFLAEAEKSKIDVDPITGEQVAKLVDEAMATPKDVVARIREALASGGK